MNDITVSEKVFAACLLAAGLGGFIWGTGILLFVSWLVS